MHIRLSSVQRIDHTHSTQDIYVVDGLRSELWGRIHIRKMFTINKDSANLLPSLRAATIDEIWKAIDQTDNEKTRLLVQKYVVHLDDDYTKTGNPLFNVFDVQGWWLPSSTDEITEVSFYGDHLSAKAARVAMLEWIRDMFDPK